MRSRGLVWLLAVAVTGLAAILVAVAAATGDAPAPASTFKPFVFIHAGDTELGSPTLKGTKAGFATLAERANKLGAAFVIIAGDITRNCTAEQLAAYEECHSLFKMPVHVVPGNHDEPAFFKKSFGPDRYVFTHGNSDFVCLNSNLIDGGHSAAEEAKAQWKWFEESLAASRRRPCTHLFVVFHHPDAAEGAEMRQPLAKYRVEAVLCGHTHTTEEHAGKGYTVYTSPGTAKFRDRKGLGYRVFRVLEDRIEQEFVPLEKEEHEQRTRNAELGTRNVNRERGTRNAELGT